MKEITLLPTCDPNVFYCPQKGKMFVSIIKHNKIIKYIPLTKFLEEIK